MTTIKTTIDGEEQEFEVLRINHMEAGKHVLGSHYVDGNGDLLPVVEMPPYIPRGPQRFDPRIYLRRIRPQHTFGGVVYEERGVRLVKPDEPFLWDNGAFGIWPINVRTGFETPKMILHPVSLKGE